MTSTSNKSARRLPGVTRRTFTGSAIAAAAVAGVAPFNIVRGQAAALKVGVILPKSGPQAFFGQSCQRGIDIAPALLAEMGYNVKLDVTSVDFETNVDLARSRAEKLVNDGAHVLIGPFDSGAAGAIAQVAEQKGVPFMINIAAAPQITEQGYKYVFRNFPTAPMLIGNGLSLMKEFFKATGATPKTAVFMHVNDTFGQASARGVEALFPRLEMPFKILETISYDPAARDLSVEVAKAKASGAEMVMLVSRLNDSILLVREMVKQRFEPMGIISPGSPGMYEEQFFTTLGKFSEYCVTNVPWYNPKSEIAQKVAGAFRKQFPNDRLIGHIFNVGFSFESMMIVADAYQRAKSTNGQALAEALRATKIDKRVMIGGAIQFNEKGQATTIASAALQNRNLEPKVVLPAEAQELKPVFPVPGWNNRG
ncbi:MAG: ABC transporter substrate-binding protein [Alphaproteobacteria bacterium]|nr:ABC transporter substrate-binding protein [Alphaproteobacteria bacterium]